MVDLVLTSKGLEELRGAIASLLPILKKLPPDRDSAAHELRQALGEIVKTYLAVQVAIRGYMSLAAFPDTLEQARADLLKVSDGSLRTEIHYARGDCHRIWEIYQKHLDRWFGKVLNNTDQVIVRGIFQVFASADSDAFAAMEEVSDFLKCEAQHVLTFIVPKWDREGAKAALSRSWNELKAYDEKLSASMRDLLTIEEQFRHWN
jgi:hypothetical protein